MSVAGVLGIHRVGRREGQESTARATEGLQNVGHDLVGPIGRPDLTAADPESDVPGKVLAQTRGLSVRVAIQPLAGIGDGLGHVLAHRFRRWVRVLIDVETHRDVELRGTVGLLPHQFGAKRQISQLNGVLLRLGHRTGPGRPSTLGHRGLLTVMALAWPGRFSARAKFSTESARSSRASSV